MFIQIESEALKSQSDEDLLAYTERIYQDIVRRQKLEEKTPVFEQKSPVFDQKSPAFDKKLYATEPKKESVNSLNIDFKEQSKPKQVLFSKRNHDNYF